MSHSWDCPTDYEARRRGERDYEDRGYRSYRTPYDDQCEDAAEAYHRGQRSAEYRAEEEAEECRRYEQVRRQQEEWDRIEAEQEYWDRMNEQQQDETEYFLHCKEMEEAIRIAHENAALGFS